MNKHDDIALCFILHISRKTLESNITDENTDTLSMCIIRILAQEKTRALQGALIINHYPYPL
jgi:hypothetical protein